MHRVGDEFGVTVRLAAVYTAIQVRRQEVATQTWCVTGVKLESSRPKLHSVSGRRKQRASHDAPTPLSSHGQHGHVRGFGLDTPVGTQELSPFTNQTRTDVVVDVALTQVDRPDQRVRYAVQRRHHRFCRRVMTHRVRRSRQPGALRRGNPPRRFQQHHAYRGVTPGGHAAGVTPRGTRDATV